MAGAFFRILIPVFATAVYGYCVFLFFSFSADKDAMCDYNFFVAFGCAAIASFVNFRLARRAHSYGGLSVANGALLLSTAFFCFAAPNTIEGVLQQLCAALVFLAPVLCALLFSREAPSANTMLIYSELSIVGTAFFLALQLGEFVVPQRVNVLCVVSLVLNLGLLSALRVTGSEQKRVSVRQGTWRGAILAGALALASVLAVLGAVLLLPSLREAIFAAIDAVRAFFVFVGEATEGFVGFLMALLPPPKPSELEALSLGEFAELYSGGEQAAEMSFLFGTREVVILAGIVVCVVCVVLFRFRKRRARRTLCEVERCEEEPIAALSLRMSLSGLLVCVKARLFFEYRLFTGRGTYEVAYVRLARFAALSGLVRGKAETPRTYLRTLFSSIAAVETGDETGVEAIRVFFERIADRLDVRLFSAARQGLLPMPEAEVRVYKSALQRIFFRRRCFRRTFFACILFKKKHSSDV